MINIFYFYSECPNQYGKKINELLKDAKCMCDDQTCSKSNAFCDKEFKTCSKVPSNYILIEKKKHVLKYLKMSFFFNWCESTPIEYFRKRTHQSKTLFDFTQKLFASVKKWYIWSKMDMFFQHFVENFRLFKLLSRWHQDFLKRIFETFLKEFPSISNIM